jgi:hypothetical protein
MRMVDSASKHVPTTAIVTASYADDFERCRLLCESIDARVSGHSHHYVLVAHHDMDLFRQLQSLHRTIVSEADLLPRWLFPVRDPLSRFRRHVWLSLKAPPLRGWHVQQLRRMAIARALREDAFLYVDSDVVFVRDFDCSGLWRDGRLRLYREDEALLRPVPGNQLHWSGNAARILGITPPEHSAHDYIGTLIAWRRDTLERMLDHIEAVHGRHWCAAIAADRQFSECMIYGRYADEIADPELHFHDGRQFCAVHWFAPAPDTAELAALIAGLAPWQVAIGVQSFLKTDINMLRRASSL